MKSETILNLDIDELTVVYQVIKHYREDLLKNSEQT